MQAASNGQAEDVSFQEGQYQFFGCELSRATELIDNELVGEEFVHPLAKIQVCLLTFLPQAVVLFLLDRYPNLEIHMVNNIVIVGVPKTLEYHEFPSTLEVKRLVAQEDPCVRLGVWLVICL